MKLLKAAIKNFRRLEDVEIEFDEKETVFVGPNNSGKTTATAVFRCFLGSRNFKIHDFSMAKIGQIDAYNPDDETSELPDIGLDLWFSFKAAEIEFGRVFALLPNLSESLDQVGISCNYCVKKSRELWNAYNKVFPTLDDGTRRQTLSHFLGIEDNLKSHFEITYSTIDGETEPAAIDPKEGKKILASLIRTDFVDAQRNMNDEEVGHSNKLSTAFASYYKGNHTQLGFEEASIQVIDDNNQRLTDHYGNSFEGLLQVVRGLGVPSANDRVLKLVSSMNAETALKGSADLMYIDAGSQHELPEAYNGLGFKNLVYMAIQVRHYHLQWLNTEKNRPLCHLIFIEEPEVHLHAQVQQTFIEKMWTVLDEASGQGNPTPQFVVTTHSSHVIDTVDFEKVRYFRRCFCSNDDPLTQKIQNATVVRDLRKFSPEAVDTDDENVSPNEVLNFLKKYMTLTHCDLFFADGVILAEGSVERILLRPMIEKCAPNLKSKYITTLEVGGAYAHRFVSLLEFLNIPYLVLTDIDSVIKQEGDKRPKACCTIEENAVTSNGALKFFFRDTATIADLAVLAESAHIQEDDSRYISFQKRLTITINMGEGIIETCELHGRTLEETFIYENLNHVEAGALQIGWQVPKDISSLQYDVYKLVKSSSFKKTEFALNVLASDDWEVPDYIKRGLRWLEQRLSSSAEEQDHNG